MATVMGIFLLSTVNLDRLPAFYDQCEPREIASPVKGGRHHVRQEMKSVISSLITEWQDLHRRPRAGMTLVNRCHGSDEGWD